MKILIGLFLFVMLIFPAGTSGFSAEEVKDPMLEKMKVYGAPADAHKVLEDFAGTWRYSGKFWMTPDSEPQEMTGMAVHTMIYGGRFLKQEVTGPWMNEIFEGIGFTGYDNIRNEYESVWLDSTMTGIYKVSGKYDPATKTLSQSGANSCPLTGDKMREGRSVWTVTDPNHLTFTSYTSTSDGKEFKSMEMTYNRQP